MRRLNIWTRNHHTPWLTLFADALSEHLVFALPSMHAPLSWRDDQRPLPPNVHPTDEGAIDLAPPDLILLHTPHDLQWWAGRNESRLYVAHNKDAFDGGESVAFTLNTYGVPLVAISEMKAQSWRDAGYVGPIDVIPPYVNVEDYGNWTGEGGYILTVCNGLDRPLFDKAAWLEATRDLPVKLVGEGNQGIRGSIGPAQSWNDLKSLFRCAAVYLSVNKWPFEDGHNLALLEAMATGCPVAALQHPNLPPGLVWVRDGDALRETLESILGDGPTYALTQADGRTNREIVSAAFPLSTFRDKWLSVLERVTA